MNACSREAFYLTVHMGERLFDLKTNNTDGFLSQVLCGSQSDRGHAGEK